MVYFRWYLVNSHVQAVPFLCHWVNLHGYVYEYTHLHSHGISCIPVKISCWWCVWISEELKINHNRAVSYAYFSLGTSPNNARKSTPCVRHPSMFVLGGSLDKLQISHQSVTNRMEGWAFRTLNVANDACPPMLGHTSSNPSEDLSTTGPCSGLSQPPPVQVPRSGHPDTEKHNIFSRIHPLLAKWSQSFIPQGT